MAKAPQLKGAWMITSTPRHEGAASSFTSLGAINPVCGAINSAAGNTFGGTANDALGRSASQETEGWIATHNHEFAITYAPADSAPISFFALIRNSVVFLKKRWTL